MRATIRSEFLEAKIFVQWLRRQGLKHSHLPLESASFRQLVKNKANGTCKGVPDYLVITPKQVLFVELKRASGGRVSKEQKAWVEALTAAGCPAKVCRGAAEAIKFVEEFL